MKLLVVSALFLAYSALVAGQTIESNPFPQNGDICRDKGTSWEGLYLGPCAKGTHCQAYKRGVYKCVSDNPRVGAMAIGALCYNETAVKLSEKARTFFKQRNCLWDGVDAQGTPKVQCIKTKEPGGIYRCGHILPLFKKGCFVVAGSMIWGKYNQNQAYDACNGCPCTLPGLQGKYPLCYCNAACTPMRQKLRCPVD